MLGMKERGVYAMEQGVELMGEALQGCMMRGSRRGRALGLEVNKCEKQRWMHYGGSGGD